MPKLEFTNIVKRYGMVPVLKDLSLSVDDGEFLVLLGPSGCGKTTLLNLLAGLLEVTSGTITIGGRDVTDLDPKDRGLAMVFQSYALYPTKTVRGNLKFGLAARKLPAAEVEARVGWAAKLLQIEPLLDRKPGELSGGQRQRVAIGRALVKKVDVCLFDEPLSNLDAKLRTEMRLEIKKLHDELHSTIVYVTHDQIEAMTMATRIAVMDQGLVQQFGTPDEIYGQPANLFVAGFIGTPAMNLIDARLSLAGDAVTAVHEPTGARFDLSRYGFTEAPRDGASIVLGLRPEHFSLAPSDGGIELPVHYTERTGSDATTFLKFGDGLLSVRVDSDQAPSLRTGTVVRAGFPGHKANVFDPATGLRL